MNVDVASAASLLGAFAAASASTATVVGSLGRERKIRRDLGAIRGCVEESASDEVRKAGACQADTHRRVLLARATIRLDTADSVYLLYVLALALLASTIAVTVAAGPVISFAALGISCCLVPLVLGAWTVRVELTRSRVCAVWSEKWNRVPPRSEEPLGVLAWGSVAAAYIIALLSQLMTLVSEPSIIWVSLFLALMMMIDLVGLVVFVVQILAVYRTYARPTPSPNHVSLFSRSRQPAD